MTAYLVEAGVKKSTSMWRCSKVVMQWTATPPSSVRFRPAPPNARVAKLVDARDLKSLGGNTVPVQVRPRAPFFRFKLILTRSILRASSVRESFALTNSKFTLNPLITLLAHPCR